MQRTGICILILLTLGLQALAKTEVPVTARLLEAAQNGDLKTVKELAAQKADLNAQGAQKLTALMQATATGRAEVVAFLLQKKVALELKNEAGDTALAMAVGNEQEDIALRLVRAGARLDASCGDGTLLMCAVKTNSVAMIRRILAKFPDELSKKDAQGKTASDYAKEGGTAKTRRALGIKSPR